MMVVVGDSHTIRLGQALRLTDDPAIVALKRRFGGIAAARVLPGHHLREPFFTTRGDAVLFAREPRSVIAELAGTDGAIRAGDGHVYGFSMGFHTAFMLAREYWRDFTLLPCLEGKSFVSSAAFRAMVLASNAHVLDFARALVKMGVDAFLLAAPPIRDAMIDRQAPIASREELIVVQQQFVAVMAHALQEIGMPFVPVPLAAAADGVLKSEYDGKGANDVHHGNQHFGQLQWRAIADHFDVAAA